MKLFQLQDWKVEVAPEVLNLVDFKELLKRDKSKNKDKAVNELSFIFFFCDSRSDYLFIEDPKERMDTIKIDLALPKSWTPDEAVSKAMETYMRLSVTVYSTTLDDIRVAIKNLSQNLRKADYSSMDANEISKVASSLKQIGPLLKEFKELERSVLLELEEGSISSKDRTILDGGFKILNDIKALTPDGN